MRSAGKGFTNTREIRVAAYSSAPTRCAGHFTSQEADVYPFRDGKIVTAYRDAATVFRLQASHGRLVDRDLHATPPRSA